MTASFRLAVVGMGVQGPKRVRSAGADVVATVDPVHADAQFERLQDVPLEMFDAAAVCTPDGVKVDLLRYLLSNGKHVLVEKPLVGRAPRDLIELKALAKSQGAVCYTAYNHRFEPHFQRMRDIVASGALGRVYHARLFYGNGTARDVRDSVWRDQGAGVLPDLGSHLLDTISFWFGVQRDDFEVILASRHENAAFDHVILMTREAPHIELEMSLLSWRNDFSADVTGSDGSAHITSLCKWGPSTFIQRKRVLPSGRPEEESETLEQDDPTWIAEYDHFRRLCLGGGSGNIDNDVWLETQLRRLGDQAMARFPA